MTDTERVLNVTRVGDVATPQVPLPLGSTCALLDEVFQSEPGRSSVLVETSADKVLLVNRHTFFQTMTGPLGYGRTLHYRRPVADVITGWSVVLQATTPLEEAALQTVGSTSVALGDDVLVRSDTGWATLPIARLYQHMADNYARRAAEVERSQDQLQALLENAVDVIVVLDAQGRVRSRSRDVAGMATMSVGELGFADVVEQDAVELRASIQRLLDDPSAAVVGEFRACALDGGIRVFEYTARNLLADPAVEGIVVNHRDITERRVLEDRLRHHATHDALTGLPNRELLFHRATYALDRLERTPGTVTLFYCDLDGFKAVNDGLGHAVGDELLIQAGERLAGVLRRGDTLARFGGDEFVVLVEDHSGSQAVTLAARLLDAFHQPFDIAARPIEMSISVGFATATEPQPASSLLKQADAAMYAAKSGGRNRFSQFNAVAHERELREHRLTADLRLAMARDEFSVVYQPIFETAGLRIAGVEALLRWNHPLLGAVTPTEFIPLAENQGLIGRIGRWVIDEACHQLSRWAAAGRGHGWMSVNLSANQLDDPDLVGHIAEALASRSLPPGCLQVELTETGVVEQVPARLATLAALRALGVVIALDDFGTGYSSLSTLSVLPIDTVKVDRSFVAELGRAPESAVMLQGIVDLAHSLGYRVVAEGVEREAELRVLERIGCDYLQGFLLALPDDFDAVLSRPARFSQPKPIAAAPAS